MLDRRTIIKLVKEKYGITIIGARKIRRGSANIYKLKSREEEYILKEFQQKYQKQDIDKEINIINHLLKDDIKVPVYIKLLNGEYSFIHLEQVIIMQKFIKGSVLNKNKCDLEQTLESAKYLGKIIKSLEKFPYSHDYVSERWESTDFSQAVEKHKNLMSEVKNIKYNERITKDLNDKIKIMKKLNKKELPNINKITIKYTHGDYSVMQFIYFDNKINAILDFVAAREMPIIFEIIRSYSYIYCKNKNGNFDLDAFVLYVKEFQKYSSLNEYDLKYMPYIYLIQLLKSTYGYKQYIEEGNQELLKFGFYRTKICKNLYKNIDKIAEKLTKEIAPNFVD